MGLPEEIEAELSQAREAEKEGNDGKSRVCARRAVGKAFTLSRCRPQTAPALSATQILRTISADPTFPKTLCEAARRLSTSVARDGGSSVSTQPVHDALLIISWLLEK